MTLNFYKSSGFISYLGPGMLVFSQPGPVVSLVETSIMVWNRLRGQGGSRVIFLVFEYLKIWDSGSQELFTESKYLALVLRTDSSKLGPTRAFFNIFPFLYRKIGLKKETFLTNLLSTFCMLMLENRDFWPYNDPKIRKK